MIGVVALMNGARVTLNRFDVEPTGIRLQPANSIWNRYTCAWTGPARAMK